MTVTNDAERVVSTLISTIAPSAGVRRLYVYRDSMGVWDGLDVQRARFAGFYSLQAATLDEAVARAVAYAVRRAT